MTKPKKKTSQVTLDEATRNRAQEIGGGNLSLGLRIAVACYKGVKLAAPAKSATSLTA